MAKEDKSEVRSNGGEHRHDASAGGHHDQPRQSFQHLLDSAGGAERGPLIASAALIGIGALLQPELFTGMLLGAGVVYASRNLPQLSRYARPLFKQAVRLSYTAATTASELFAEASEQVQDTLAEARMEFFQRDAGHGPH